MLFLVVDDRLRSKSKRLFHFSYPSVIRDKRKWLRRPSSVFWYPVPGKIPGTLLVVLELLAHGFLIEFTCYMPPLQRLHREVSFSPCIESTSTRTEYDGKPEWIRNSSHNTSTFSSLHPHSVADVRGLLRVKAVVRMLLALAVG